MPHTNLPIGPADSASQVSTNRGPDVGRQPATQGAGYRGDTRGSMLGRTVSNGHDRVTGAGSAPFYRHVIAPPAPAGGQHQSGVVQGSALGRQGTRRQSDVHVSINRREYQAAAPSGSTVLGRQRGYNNDYHHEDPVPRNGTDISLPRDYAAGDQRYDPAPVVQRHIARQLVPEIPPNREQSVARRPSHAQDVYEVNRGFGSMNLNQDVNVGINNYDRAYPRPQALARQPRTVSQVFLQRTPSYLAPQQQDGEYITQKRFVPLTWCETPDLLIEDLCSLFKVQALKVRDWIRADLIRVDLQKWRDGLYYYDIEPLTAQLTPRDIEKWDVFVNASDKHKEIDQALGPSRPSYNTSSRCRDAHQDSRVEDLDRKVDRLEGEMWRQTQLRPRTVGFLPPSQDPNMARLSCVACCWRRRACEKHEKK